MNDAIFPTNDSQTDRRSARITFLVILWPIILGSVAGGLAVNAQQMIAYKVAQPPPPYNYQAFQDIVDAHYIITLGEGFDPTVDYYGLRAKVWVSRPLKNWVIFA